MALDQLADAVDMAADEMPAQPPAHHQRPLQVDRAAGRRVAQIGAGERFRPGLKGQLSPSTATTVRQQPLIEMLSATAVSAAIFGLADDQPAAGRLARTSATVPNASTIPENMGNPSG